MTLRIHIDKEQIAMFCRRHHIRKLSLFGSVLHDNFSADSDVDVIVEFEESHIPGFIKLHFIEEELSRLLGGRKIDLVTPKSLHRLIRTKVLDEAEVQYVEG